MISGRLRHRVILQAKTITRDSMGGEIITWVDQDTVWAMAEPLRGREFFSSLQQQAEVTIRFSIRYWAAITQAWRVIWETQAYDIVQVIDVGGRHVEMEIMARTQQNV